MKLNFVVFVRNNNSRLLQFVEYLHCNPHCAKFHCHPFKDFVVVFVYEGGDKVLEEATRIGVVLIPQQEVKK
jgi:hypothetical protein